MIQKMMMFQCILYRYMYIYSNVIIIIIYYLAILSFAIVKSGQKLTNSHLHVYNKTSAVERRIINHSVNPSFRIYRKLFSSSLSPLRVLLNISNFREWIRDVPSTSFTSQTLSSRSLQIESETCACPASNNLNDFVCPRSFLPSSLLYLTSNQTLLSRRTHTRELYDCPTVR